MRRIKMLAGFALLTLVATLGSSSDRNQTKAAGRGPATVQSVAIRNPALPAKLFSVAVRIVARVPRAFLSVVVLAPTEPYTL
jgi:hypothetical protein